VTRKAIRHVKTLPQQLPKVYLWGLARPVHGLCGPRQAGPRDWLGHTVWTEKSTGRAESIEGNIAQQAHVSLNRRPSDWFHMISVMELTTDADDRAVIFVSHDTNWSSFIRDYGDTCKNVFQHHYNIGVKTTHPFVIVCLDGISLWNPWHGAFVAN